MAFFIEYISEYNMHAFQGWQRWQRIKFIISDTSMKNHALTNVDKRWQIWGNPEIHSQRLTKHDTYIILLFWLKKKIIYCIIATCKHLLPHAFTPVNLVNAVNLKIHTPLISENVFSLAPAIHLPLPGTSRQLPCHKLPHIPDNSLMFPCLRYCIRADFALFLWQNRKAYEPM